MSCARVDLAHRQPGEIEKATNISVSGLEYWLLDLGSNQGHTD